MEEDGHHHPRVFQTAYVGRLILLPDEVRLRGNSTNSKISLFSPNKYPPTTTITLHLTANPPTSITPLAHAHPRQTSVDHPTLNCEIGNSCYVNENYNCENGKLKYSDDKGEYDITSRLQSWTTTKMKKAGFHREHNLFHNDNLCPREITLI